MLARSSPHDETFQCAPARARIRCAGWGCRPWRAPALLSRRRLLSRRTVTVPTPEENSVGTIRDDDGALGGHVAHECAARHRGDAYAFSGHHQAGGHPRADQQSPARRERRERWTPRPMRRRRRLRARGAGSSVDVLCGRVPDERISDGRQCAPCPRQCASSPLLMRCDGAERLQRALNRRAAKRIEGFRRSASQLVNRRDARPSLQRQRLQPPPHATHY